MFRDFLGFYYSLAQCLVVMFGYHDYDEGVSQVSRRALETNEKYECCTL